MSILDTYQFAVGTDPDFFGNTTTTSDKGVTIALYASGNGTGIISDPSNFGKNVLRKGGGTQTDDLVFADTDSLTRLVFRFRIAVASNYIGGVSGSYVFDANRFNPGQFAFYIDTRDDAGSDTAFPILRFGRSGGSGPDPFDIYHFSDQLKHAVELIVDDTDVTVSVDGVEVFSQTRVAFPWAATFGLKMAIGRGGNDFQFAHYTWLDNVQADDGITPAPPPPPPNPNSNAISYPPSLPKPLINGYSLTPMASMMTSEPDFGTLRLRPLYTNTPVKATVSWEFYDYEFLIFDNWFIRTTRNGTQKFDIELSDNDQGLVWWSACFNKGWKASQQQAGTTWIVTAEMYLYASFVDRPFYGDLNGEAFMSITAQADMLVRKFVEGLAELSITASGQLSGTVSTLHGVANLAITSQLMDAANIPYAPLRGSAELTITVTEYDYPVPDYFLLEDGSWLLKEDLNHILVE